MKDIFARGEIKNMQNSLSHLQGRVPDIEIQSCPFCLHDTIMHKEILLDSTSTATLFYATPYIQHYYLRCLNCGKLWSKTEKTMLQEVEK